MNSMKFESLDEDLEDLLDKIYEKLETGVPSKHCNEERKRFIFNLDQSLNRAKNILNKMEIQAKQAPVKYQAKMNSKISNYNGEIQRYRTRVNQLRYPDFNDSENINPVSHNSSADLETNIRKQVLIGTATLDRTSESLARSHTIAIETEQIGTEVLGELGTQRETLERTRDRLVETHEEISRSKKIIRAIGRNLFYNKILLIVIIILEMLILGGLIYWKFFT
ncbi:Vesicle transport through interaction with t-SNAREs-like protein 1B [Armadillidium vulgare]|nr:Vesicle transport through interaction with t-SNAREs-like protein 1B [Armadillidium vulgare]